MQHWPRYLRNRKQRTHNKGSLLTGVEQRGDRCQNSGKIDDDLRSAGVVEVYNRSSASEGISGERSDSSEQTVVSESEQVRFLIGHPSCSSRECRLDMDSEMSVSRQNRLSEVLAEIPSQGGCFGFNQINYATSPSTGLDISTSEIIRQGDAFTVSRRPRSKTSHKVNQHRPIGPFPLDICKAYRKTNNVAMFSEEDEVPTANTVQRSRHMGESFKIIRSNVDSGEGGAEIERVSNFETERRVNGQIGGQGTVAGCSGCFGRVTNGTGSFPGERSTLSSQGSSDIVSQGLRCRKSNAGSYVSGRGSSKRSLRKFSCISSGDVLPSVTNPVADGVPNHVFNRQKLGTYNTKHKSGSLTGLRNRKSSVCNEGCMVHRNLQSELGGLPPEQNVPNVDPSPARSKKASVSAFKSSKWCLKMPTSMKSDTMVSNSTVAHINSISQASNVGHNGGGRESPRISTDSCRELASPKLLGNSNRGLGLSGRQSGLMEIDRRNTTRTWVNHGVSSTTASFMHDSHNASSSIFSGPPSTLRTPPLLSPFGMSDHTRSVEAMSSPSSYMSSPDVQISNSDSLFSYASTTQSPDMSRAVSSLECHDGHHLLRAGTPVYRPFQQRSLEESQMRFTFDGIPEVFSGRDHVERDRISNEQFFMLEANLYFGGIASYDQHRDMRLDVDNMSYEELLALEESIGNVCTGLGKDVISRCLKSKTYAFPHTDTNFIPEESEVKCSICQEEFEEDVKLGVLDCGHSHHFLCIEQWLLQKNLCPICKASASS